MNRPLVGPGDRYRLAVEALASQDGKHFTRHLAEVGIPTRHLTEASAPARSGEGGGSVTGEAPGAPPSSYLVMVDETCSLLLMPGENGITVKDIRLLDACHLRMTARVTPGCCPPDWLASEATYLLFDGDYKTAHAQPDRYIPFDGMVAEDAWPQADFAPLDLLAVAVGRSVERANGLLACNPSAAGTALVSSVTVRVGLSRVDLGQNRVLLTLARPEGGAADQFVELQMTTSFAAAPEEDDEEA